jgi:hypothetical protein
MVIFLQALISNMNKQHRKRKHSNHICNATATEFTFFHNLFCGNVRRIKWRKVVLLPWAKT